MMINVEQSVEDWQEKLKYWEETCPNDALSTTNPA
jgi:hypothetical protein